MGMLDWFKQIAGGREAALPDEEGSAELAGLDFKTAIDAHMKWKVRLEAVIDGRSEETLDVAVVSCDNRCTLGQWLEGAGHDTFGADAVFGELVERHRDFHREAGAVLELAQAGNRDAALKLLRGDYYRNSERVKVLLARLYAEHQT